MDKIKAAEEVQAINGTLLLTELLKRADEKNDNGQPVIRDIEDNIGGMTKYVRYDAMVFELNKLLKTAALSTQSPKWVSVEDDLPEVGEYVLVYNTEGATLVARCLMNGWAAFFADGEKLMGELKATHWMPLPSSPNSESPSSTHPLQEKIDAMTDDERMELFGKYCKYCGSKDPNCQCWNDD